MKQWRLTCACPGVLLSSRRALQENNGATAVPEPMAKVGKKAAVPVDADMEVEQRLAAMVCSLENKDECLACGS